jgi:hypothetical protein
MTETLLMLYAMFAAAGTFALLSLLGAVELRARRQRSRANVPAAANIV